MTQNVTPINTTVQAGSAPLRNVTALLGAAERALHRPAHLPGLVVMHGPSGYGKSCAAVAVMNSYRGYYTEVKSTWTRKYLAESILRQMRLPVSGTTPALVDRIGQHLMETGRLLIVDEADYLVQRGMVEIVRDIYLASESPVLLIGEEQLPAKLEASERVHGRVLEWIAAQPADLSDARRLAALHCPGLAVADDLLSKLVALADGSVRRLCVNLQRIREAADVEPPARADAAWWGTRELYSGRPAALRGRR